MVDGQARVARGFARYLVALDPATEVPPVGLIREPSHRIVPYIYSDEDIDRLMAAAGRLPTEHRADTYRHVIGLLSVTGMRVGEAVRLDRNDVDLDQGLLTISQFEVREITAVAATPDDGGSARRLRTPERPATAQSEVTELLHFDNGNAVAARQREHRRSCLVRDAGLIDSGRGRRPRLHDLRHALRFGA